MEDCFSNMCTFGTGYKRAKGYFRADFNAPETTMINEVKSTTELGLCFKCSQPHFQHRCTANTGHPTNKFPKYKKVNNPQMFCQKNHNSDHFHTGTISFQASQQIREGDDVLLSVNTIKHFLGKIGEKYTLQKK